MVALEKRLLLVVLGSLHWSRGLRMPTRLLFLFLFQGVAEEWVKGLEASLGRMCVSGVSLNCRGRIGTQILSSGFLFKSHRLLCHFYFTKMILVAVFGRVRRLFQALLSL